MYGMKNLGEIFLYFRCEKSSDDDFLVFLVFVNDDEEEHLSIPGHFFESAAAGFILSNDFVRIFESVEKSFSVDIPPCHLIEGVTSESNLFHRGEYSKKT